MTAAMNVEPRILPSLLDRIMEIILYMIVQQDIGLKSLIMTDMFVLGIRVTRVQLIALYNLSFSNKSLTAFMRSCLIIFQEHEEFSIITIYVSNRYVFYPFETIKDFIICYRSNQSFPLISLKSGGLSRSYNVYTSKVTLSNSNEIFVVPSYLLLKSTWWYKVFPSSSSRLIN